MQATLSAIVSCPSKRVIVMVPGPSIDVHVIEDVAGLDAAPEEDGDARTVVVHHHVVEGMRPRVGHAGGRLDELRAVVRIGHHRGLVTRARGVADRRVRAGADDLLAAVAGIGRDRDRRSCRCMRSAAMCSRRRPARPAATQMLATPSEPPPGSTAGSVIRRRAGGSHGLRAEDPGDEQGGDREEQGHPGAGGHRQDPPGEGSGPEVTVLLQLNGGWTADRGARFPSRRHDADIAPEGAGWRPQGTEGGRNAHALDRPGRSR